VRIAVAESVTPSLLPEAIAEYQKEHPGVGFHVLVAGPEVLMASLIKDSVDLILTHESPGQPGLSVLAVAEHPLCAFVAPSHPLAGEPAVSLRQCAQYPCAMPDHSLTARQLLDMALQETSVPLRPAIESDSIETLKAFARLGQAVCFSFHLGSTAEMQGLVPLFISDQRCMDARLYLAARRGRVLPVAAASFAERLGEGLRSRIVPRRASVA
jgi:DNA-binding transcriptional LysR family regulator